MTVNQISLVYGFTIKNAELLKLLLAQMEKDPKFVANYETYDSVETDAANESEWTHNGKLYEFHGFPYFFCQGPNDKKGLEKTRALFPELPEGVRMFHNPMDHANTWHLGIEISYMETGWADKRKKVKPIDPVALVEKHSDTLRTVLERYGHALKEERPVIFEVTDDCACCS